MPIILVWIIVSGYTPLIYYWTALLGVLVIVNYLKSLSSHAKNANLLSILFIVIITLNRTRTIHFNDFAEAVINILEHLFFAFLTCYFLWIILETFCKNYVKPRTILIITILLYTSIGIINEIFQNTLSHHPVFSFSTDSVKDIIVNTVGSLLFAALVLTRINRKLLFEEIQSLNP